MDSQPACASDRFRIRLTGPGIAEQAGIAPEMRGIPVEEFKELMAVNADYPLGVDAIFVLPNGELMAIPRSTRIEVR
jgi:alpha-D-ribose 1-methylphosphonate 5-triphosphate synthase subunit PhnH